MLKNIVSYSLTIIILVLLYFFTGEMVLICAASALIGMIILSAIIGIIVSGKITIHAEVDTKTQQGQVIRLKINVHNKSFIPFVRGKINVVVENTSFGIKRGLFDSFCLLDKTGAIELKIASMYCGKININIRSVRIFDFMGITSRKRFHDVIKGIYVFPDYSRVMGVTEYVSQNYEKEKYFRNKKNSNLSEILQYREYQRGDGLKLINWKLTDKFGQLMVREFDTPLDNNIIVVFDINSDDKICISTLCGVLMAISDSYIYKRIEHQMAWYNPVSGKLCVKEITEKNGLYEYMRTVLDRLSSQKAGALNMLIINSSIYRYARVIYVTNKMTDDIGRALAVYHNIDIIIVDEKMAHGNDSVTRIGSIAI